MKLRIKGDSLRLRLTKSELDEMSASGKVGDIIHFPGQQQLHYSIQADVQATTVSALFDDGEIKIMVPPATVEKWVTTDLVGFSAQIPLDEARQLDILVEKDFQCLIPRAEDETGLFANPQATQNK